MEGRTGREGRSRVQREVLGPSLTANKRRHGVEAEKKSAETPAVRRGVTTTAFPALRHFQVLSPTLTTWELLPNYVSLSVGEKICGIHVC